MKTKLLSLRLAILVIVIFFSATNLAVGSHGSGMELSYTHLTGGTYHFKFVIYKECFTNWSLQAVMMSVNSVSCGVSTSAQLQSMQVTGTNITLICPGSIPYCYGGTAPGFEKWVYEGDVVLSGQCPDWTFSITDCCRSAIITTLNSATSESEYTVARLNNLNGDNNSPQFTNDIFPYIPLGQNFHYNHGMFDPDGDSLVYNLVCARSSPNNCVNYSPGYSALQPISSAPPITFDAFTGDLVVNPTALEVGVIAFEIQDYRNGELMGSVMRDVVIWPLPMNLDNPTLTGMNGTSQQIAYVFPDDTICFDIFSNDTTPQDTLTMTWNQVIPGATFTTVGTPHPTGTFCWTPTINDVRSQPYMFTSRIQDNACELNAGCVYSYYIYVTLDSSLVFMNASEPSGDSHLSIFPNPSTGIFEIKSGEKISEINVFDSFGKYILKSRTARINLSGQREGIYFAEVLMHDGKMQYHKIIRQ